MKQHGLIPAAGVGCCCSGGLPARGARRQAREAGQRAEEDLQPDWQRQGRCACTWSTAAAAVAAADCCKCAWWQQLGPLPVMLVSRISCIWSWSKGNRASGNAELPNRVAQIQTQRGAVVALQYMCTGAKAAAPVSLELQRRKQQQPQARSQGSKNLHVVQLRELCSSSSSSCC